MRDLFLTCLSVSLSTGALILLLTLLSPLLEKKYAAKWKYWIWILLAVRLLIPISGIYRPDRGADSVPNAVSVGVENGTVLPLRQARRFVVEIPVPLTQPAAAQMPKRLPSPLDAAAALWALGALVYFSFHMVSYLHYRRLVERDSVPASKECVSWLMQGLRDELHIRRQIPVAVYAPAASPMIIGFLRPVLVLPDADFGEKDLAFILRHELIHFRRGDIYFKLLFVAVNAVHWFNPLIWLMQKQAALDMELSCDEGVIDGADLASRRAYTETLLSSLRENKGKGSVLSTQFYGGKETMKKRFVHILKRIKKKNGIPVLICAAILAVGLGAAVGCVAKTDAGSTATEGSADTAGGSDMNGADGSSPSETDASGSENSDGTGTSADETDSVGGAGAQTSLPGYTSEQLIQMASECYAYLHDGYVPGHIEIDSISEDGMAAIHLYDMTEENTATLDWYTVDIRTGLGENVNLEQICLGEFAPSDIAVASFGEHRQAIIDRILAVFQEAEAPRYRLENPDLESPDLVGARADCIFHADWISIREPEDDPMIRGMRSVADALTDPDEIAYAEEIIDGWIAEMKEWAQSDENIQMGQPVTLLFDYAGTCLLYYPYTVDGVTTLIPLEEMAASEWTEDPQARFQEGADTLNQALALYRDPEGSSQTDAAGGTDSSGPDIIRIHPLYGTANGTGLPAGTLSLEDFWARAVKTENTVTFFTGLTLTFPESWDGKYVLTSDIGPTNAPTSNTLIVSEKTNYEAGPGGDLFYLRFLLHEEDSTYGLEPFASVLGLYRQGDREYALVLEKCQEMAWVEGDETYRAAYEALSQTADSVTVGTDGMDGFTPCGIDDIPWIERV